MVQDPEKRINCSPFKTLKKYGTFVIPFALSIWWWREFPVGHWGRLLRLSLLQSVSCGRDEGTDTMKYSHEAMQRGLYFRTYLGEKSMGCCPGWMSFHEIWGIINGIGCLWGRFSIHAQGTSVSLCLKDSLDLFLYALNRRILLSLKKEGDSFYLLLFYLTVILNECVHWT